MLHDFVTLHRNELIRRCREKVAKRFEPAEVPAVVDHGVPVFLQQLVETLRLHNPVIDRNPGEPEPVPVITAIGRSAALHGAELLRHGYTVDQVVHDYGDVCQAVTELAIDQETQIDADEFRILNGCLDNAISDAVTAYAHSRHGAINAHADGLQLRLDTIADEQRQLVDIAIHAYAAIKTGSVGLTGATSALLEHALAELRSLADRSRSEIRPTDAVGTSTSPNSSDIRLPGD